MGEIFTLKAKKHPPCVLLGKNIVLTYVITRSILQPPAYQLHNTGKIYLFLPIDSVNE